MIKVTIGTNTSRTSIIVEPTATLKDCFNKAGVDFSKAVVHLDGSAVSAKDMNSSLETLGVTQDCFLIAVVKTENN